VKVCGSHCNQACRTGKRKMVYFDDAIRWAMYYGTHKRGCSNYWSSDSTCHCGWTQALLCLKQITYNRLWG
jgi:hypothetical protein